MSRISIEVADDQHTKIKIMASLQHKTIKDFIIDSIFNGTQQRKLNRESLAAIDEMNSKHNLNTYDTVESLFAKLR